MYMPNKNLENILSNKFKASLEDAGEVLLNKAKRNAPVDSGSLKNSLELDRGKLSAFEVEVETGVDYAEHVEYGTQHQAANPFIRSALAESKAKMLKQFKDIV